MNAPATHIVAPGETLTAIGKSYSVSAAVIAVANNLANVDFVITGTTLYIPSADGHLPDGAPNLAIHVVRAGDSLSSIAASFGVTLQSVILANGISNPDHIEVGQIIRIPRGDGVVPTPKL